MLAPWNKSYDQPRQHVKKQRHYSANKGPSSQGYGFSSSHVWMWELDYKESWTPNNWCFWTVVVKKTLESPLDCKEIQLVHPSGIQSWIFIGRTDVEAETPIIWPPDVKNWLTGKDPDAGERLKAGREGNDRRWNCWMASPIQWTWVWVGSGSWWWTERPSLLHTMGLQSRIQLSDWTELRDLWLVCSLLSYYYLSSWFLIIFIGRLYYCCFINLQIILTRWWSQLNSPENWNYDVHTRKVKTMSLV